MNRTIVLVALVTLFAGGLSAAIADDDDEGRLKIGGDMRGRFESFRFSEDETGTKKSNRARIRYRFRLNGKVNINVRAKFQFRLVSGHDSRSGNQTLGSPVDFGPNLFAIRFAYMVLMPWADGMLPNSKGYWAFHFGRVVNPFIWKGGMDKMVWDNDISLAGASTVFDYRLGESAKLSVNAGYYEIDENSRGLDPHFSAGQIRLEGGGKTLSAGIRGSYYFFAELDSSFIQRGVDGEGGVTASGGNVPDGLTGSRYGGKLEAIETQAYVKAKAGKVPLVLYGGYSDNLSAEPSQMFPGVGKESVAYNVGIEGGDKKKWIKLGTAWYHIEANAFPSQFIDSDFLDGHTNRQGLLVYFQRRVLKNTDFNLQLFGSDAIESDDRDDNGLDPSVENSERVRLQVDLVYKF